MKVATVQLVAVVVVMTLCHRGGAAPTPSQATLISNFFSTGVYQTLSDLSDLLNSAATLLEQNVVNTNFRLQFLVRNLNNSVAGSFFVACPPSTATLSTVPATFTVDFSKCTHQSESATVTWTSFEDANIATKFANKKIDFQVLSTLFHSIPPQHQAALYPLQRYIAFPAQTALSIVAPGNFRLDFAQGSAVTFVDL